MEITDKDRLDFLEAYIFSKSAVIPHILFNYEVEDYLYEENINKFPVGLCMDYEEKNNIQFARSIREAIDNAILYRKGKADEDNR